MKNIVVATLLVCLAAGAYCAENAKEKEEGFVALFNGKDLTGWEGDAKLWIVEDGVLIGRSPGIGYNDFLSTKKTYTDFILRYDIRLVDNKGNTGVQFRSKRLPEGHHVSGFQADAAEGWWMTLYDEARRNKPLVKPDPKALEKVLKPGEWNAYEVKAIGNDITLSLNGVKMVEYTETDPDIAKSGIIATQIHGGDPMEVQFRNMRIKEIK